jgi:hypothetical protein
MRDLALRERVGDVEHPHTGILVGNSDRRTRPATDGPISRFPA